MKQNGRSLKRRLQLLTNKLSRMKHYHGYGVHSPFVYSLVRKVLMCKTLFEESGTALFDALRNEGFSERRARQIHNAMHFMKAKKFSINNLEGDFVILTREYEAEKLLEGLRTACESGATLVIGQPYRTKERQNEIHKMIEEHRCTSVDNRSFIIFFNNRLPKQHYRL